MPADARQTQRNHIVQFYEDERFLCDVVVDFLEAGLRNRQPLLVIATQPHQHDISVELSKRSWSCVELHHEGRLTMLDAREMLTGLLSGGSLMDKHFLTLMAGLLRGLHGQFPEARPRVYGEMAYLLWHDGNLAACQRLEELWNELGDFYSLLLLCSYHSHEGSDERWGESKKRICDLHSHLLPTASTASKARAPDLAMAGSDARLASEIRRRAEAERALTRLIIDQEEFLTTTGHALRTPLTALMLRIERVLRSCCTEEIAVQRSEMQKISRVCDDLHAVIEQMMHPSRAWVPAADSMSKSSFEKPRDR